MNETIPVILKILHVGRTVPVVLEVSSCRIVGPVVLEVLHGPHVGDVPVASGSPSFFFGRRRSSYPGSPLPPSSVKWSSCPESPHCLHVEDSVQFGSWKSFAWEMFQLLWKSFM